MRWSNYCYSVAGPGHGKWHQNVSPSLPPGRSWLVRQPPLSLGGALRDEKKNGCVGDYYHP